jgi:hypothetical protein
MRYQVGLFYGHPFMDLAIKGGSTLSRILPEAIRLTRYFYNISGVASAGVWRAMVLWESETTYCINGGSEGAGGWV